MYVLAYSKSFFKKCKKLSNMSKCFIDLNYKYGELYLITTTTKKLEYKNLRVYCIWHFDPCPKTEQQTDWKTDGQKDCQTWRTNKLQSRHTKRKADCRNERKKCRQTGRRTNVLSKLFRSHCSKQVFCFFPIFFSFLITYFNDKYTWSTLK